MSSSALEEEVRRGVACAVENATQIGPSLESALASPSDGPGRFRDVSIPEEDLWQLLERHDTKLDLRTRAAELLRGRVAPGELRIRVAELARSSAAGDTRDALYRIAAEDETAAAEPEPDRCASSELRIARSRCAKENVTPSARSRENRCVGADTEVRSGRPLHSKGRIQ